MATGQNGPMDCADDAKKELSKQGTRYLINYSYFF